MRGVRNRIHLVGILLAVVLLVLLSVNVNLNNTEASTNDVGCRVHYIDVEQGDSIFVELPDGKTMLIDGGEEKYGKRVVNYIKDLGYNKIDFMIATHSDSDHVGGLINVLEKLEVETIYRPFTISLNSGIKNFEDELATKFEDTIENYQVEVGEEYAEFLRLAYIESVGDRLATIKICSNMEAIISSDTDNPYMIKFFMPRAVDSFSTARIGNGYTVLRCDDNNDSSAVVEIITESSKFLFMSDLTANGEAEMLKELSGLDKTLLTRVSVLKVGHHGAMTSTSDEFLNLVSPSFGIISVGKNNDYSHPHTETIQKLANNGVRVYRTDELGTIIAEEKGSSIVFSNIETQSFFEKNDWILYAIIGVVVVALIVVVIIYSIRAKRKEKKQEESLTKPVDKSGIK